MRMAKVSLTKRNSANSRVEVEDPHEEMDEDDAFDHDDGDSDVDANFSIEDHHGELNFEKVESLLGIPLSGKAILSSSGGSGSGSSSELIIKPSRKLVAGKRKSEEKQIEIAASSSSSRGRGKVPKVTLKLGTTKNAMKVRSSNRLSIGTSGTSNAISTGEPGSPPNQQVASGGPLTPRTPGTPSDHGANTPNPPTPGNTNSSSMVNSPHQYVTITVDGEGGVPNEGGVSVGGTSSYVTYVEGSTDHSSLYAVAAAAAANGQTMTYPVYTAADSGAMYSASAAQYYTSGSGSQGVNYAQDDNDERDGMGNGSMEGLGSTDFSMLSGGSGGSSMISSSPEIDTLHQQHHALLDGGVYMVPASSANNNNNSGTSEGEGPANLSHATRVSPATNNKRKRSAPPALKPIIDSIAKDDEYDSDEDCEDESGFNEDEELEDQSETLEDGFMSSFLSKSEMKALASLYPLSNSKEQLGPSYQAKTCPDTVQWLLDNYETAEGVSLPRSTLYYHYLRHCSENKLDPVNAASFGKLIRSVFLGLRTRRLGTRGNSKYHYYGIRLKPNSALNHLPEDFPFQSGHGNTNRNNNATPAHNPGGSSACVGVVNKRLKTVKAEGYDGSHSNGFGVGESIGVQQYLGDLNGVLDDFPDLDIEVDVPEGLVDDDLVIFRSLYREHCESLLEALGNFQLGQIEALWRFFWRTSDDQAVESNADYEKILPKVKLMLLCQMKVVQDFVKEADYSFYQKMVGILLPDVLRPIPSTMTQAIRNCAKTLENWLTSAMMGYPEDMVATKITVVSALAQTLRRYTSLNHLAQAARAVLQNQNQITQMLSDLNRVDFHNVEEQASWVCGCDGDLVPNLEQDFKATLAQQQSLEQWASWLEGVVERVLRPHINTPRFVQAARHFLLKWSFYSSLIIRDLTLRSAASFGSFHLLRLLYDEYMFYLVEHRVAQVSGIVPIAVIGKKSMDPSFNSLTLSNSNLSTISGSTMVNGQTVLSSGAGNTGSPSSDGQGIIIHTNNNTSSSSYGSATVKSEFKRVKNFLIS